MSLNVAFCMNSLKLFWKDGVPLVPLLVDNFGSRLERYVGVETISSQLSHLGYQHLSSILGHLGNIIHYFYLSISKGVELSHFLIAMFENLLDKTQHSVWKRYQDRWCSSQWCLISRPAGHGLVVGIGFKAPDIMNKVLIKPRYDEP